MTFAQAAKAGVPLALMLILLTDCRDEHAGPPRQKVVAAVVSPGRILDGPPPRLTFRSGTTLGQGAIEYLGSTVTPPQAQSGQPVTLRHYFRALRPPPAGFQFFIHLVDAQSGRLVANADHRFQQGALPMDRWPVDKVVEDVHAVSFPPGTEGPLRVLLGFYLGDARLPVDMAQAQDGQNRALGPTIVFAGQQPLPEYHAKKTGAPPTVDGDLSDAVWQRAVPVTLVRSFDGRPTRRKTVARVLYDDTQLYVSFDCEDPDLWGTLLERDQEIYNQDVVEVFLDANGDGLTYNELEVSPNNVIFDAYFPAPRTGMDLSFDAQMKTAVKLRGTLNDARDTDQGWSVEMAIPLARLAAVPHLPPRPGDHWRFNLYRLEHLERQKQIEGQAFSPLFVGDFHAVRRFGILTFDAP